MIRNTETKGKHFEFTKEKHPDFAELRQIRATQDLQFGRVLKGDVGGWITCAENLEDQAWVGRDCFVYGTEARLTGYAWVTDHSAVWGRSFLSGNAMVSDRALLMNCTVRGDASVRSGVDARNSNFFGGACVIGNGRLKITDSSISGSALVNAYGYIEKDSIIAGRGVVKGKAEFFGAEITHPTHTLSVGPLGSENCTAILYRSADGDGELGHTLKIGCWTGKIEDLADEVSDRRKAEWSEELEEDRKIWTEQYDALEKLARVTVAGWK